MTKKFYNGKEISERNLVDLITECSKDNWKNSDLFRETEIACEIIAFEEYEGREEDIEYILEKIEDDATLFDVEKAIQNGEWYFMETESWKKYMRKGECEMNLEKILQEKGKIELEDGSVIIKLSQSEFNFYNSIQKKNTGNYNSGYWNSGNRNSCNYNSGNNNNGDDNTGDYNSGDNNSGDYNYGDYNSGNYNINNRNSGNYNTGNRNSGCYNSGCYNSGDFNTGNYNSGDFNSGDFNTGCFNTKTPKMNFFDQETDMTMKEWQKTEAFAILRKIDLSPVEWVWKEDMTDEEKEQYPEHETTGGYLKEIDTDKAFLSWWNSLNKREKEIIKSIPNFDSEKFFQITGIRV